MNGQGVCIFTGHRAVPKAHRRLLEQMLLKTVEALYGAGVREFCAGGAMGFDRLAADAVLSLRPRCPGMTLTLILPCGDQADRWGFSERLAYHRQVRAADRVEVLSAHYYDGCMRARNQALADRADVCVAYVTTPRTGSAQTLHMAQARGARLINLADTLPPLDED